jgi:hypothetical protein
MLEILKKVIDAQNSFYNALDLEVHDFITENESAKYHAHSYCLKNKNILFRIAQKTPTKTGWFVTAWKRDSNKITTPYDHLDQVDFLIINIVNNNKVGQFVFPKTA